MRLEDLGFDAAFFTAGAPPGPGAAYARVVRAERGQVEVLGEGGERTLVVPGSILKSGESAPTTGDWVELDPSRDVVTAVLPRKTVFFRKAAGGRSVKQVVAANVDVAFVLMGLDGDFNLRRIERYLTLVAESGARPVVLLTKAGLVADPAARAREVEAVAPGVPVRAIDVVSGHDPEAPNAFVGPGLTAAVLGSSGVGKSTLVNYMLGAEVAATRTVREHDDRGRHTTTHRELHLLPGGGAVIDTPGMRELGLWGDRASLEAAFSDVAELAARCRFTDCAHKTEPGCAVRAAVQAGAIDERRVESYLRLVAELVTTEKERVELERRRGRRKRR